MTLPRAPFKLNAIWLNLFPSHDSIADVILEFWLHHADLPNLNTAWYAFKALLRGILITEVTGIKDKISAQKEQAEQLVSQLEAQFIDSPTDSNREAWLAVQGAVDRITSSAANRKCFFNRLDRQVVYVQKLRSLPRPPHL